MRELTARRALRRDGRRRRQRRAGAEERAPRDRAGQRHADGAQPSPTWCWSTATSRAIPLLVAEGRRALRNLQRVTKLYVTKSAFAAFLILTIGTSSDAYPLLPRHLSLAASLTIGIPTFFLALAPSSRPVAARALRARRRALRRSGRGRARRRRRLRLPVRARTTSTSRCVDARTVAVTTLVVGGLYLVMALEAAGLAAALDARRRRCARCSPASTCGALSVPATRPFFALTVPSIGMVATAMLGAAIAVIGLVLCGFTPTTGPDALP